MKENKKRLSYRETLLEIKSPNVVCLPTGRGHCMVSLDESAEKLSSLMDKLQNDSGDQEK